MSRKLRKVAALALVFGGLACGPGAGPKDDGKAAALPKGKIEKVGDLVFYRDTETGLKKAKAENRRIFIDFYADWCVNCKLFMKEAAKPGPLNSALKEAVLIKLYEDEPDFDKYKQDPRFEELQTSLPFFLVLNSDGSYRWKTNRYQDQKGMIEALMAN